MTDPVVEPVEPPVVEEVAQRPSRDPRRIVIVRHGRTSYNHGRRIQGQLDSQLDEVGLRQADQVAQSLKGYGASVLVASDLARAADTARAIGIAVGLEPSYDERLREFALGDYQGLLHEELRERSEEEYAAFRAGDWDRIPGGESKAAVAGRYDAVLREVVAELGAGETAILVSHGASTRIGVARFLGWPLELALDLAPLGNCCRAELVQRETGRWALDGYNLTPDFAPASPIG